MRIILDNIIFSLQKAGGISVLWAELIKKITKNDAWKISFLEYPGSHINIFRRNLKIDAAKILNGEEQSNLSTLGRYRNPKVAVDEKFIFCSSYYRFCRNRNAVNITIVHDFTYEYFRKGPAKWINYLQKKRAIEAAQGIICISEHTKKDLLHFHPHIDESKIRVIHNGVSDDFYKIQRFAENNEAARTFNLPTGKKHLLFIGQRAGYKNFDLAVRAYAALNRPDDFHLIIIGVKLTKSEKRFVDKILDGKGYSVLSGVTNRKLNELYNIAFVLIYPSSYEGFGIPVLESMRAGTPVIALNSSSIPEVGGDAVLLLDMITPENITKHIIGLENSEHRHELIEKGIEHAKKFSWDRTMEQYIAFFRELYQEH